MAENCTQLGVYTARPKSFPVNKFGKLAQS